ADAYIYAFYGVVGGSTTGTPLGEYPGSAMTYVETNTDGDKVYSADVPADIDYIKFSDGTGSSNAERTDNIGNAYVSNNALYTITTKGSKYWGVDISTYGNSSGGNTDDDNTDDNTGGNTGDNTSTGTNSTYYLRGTLTDWDPGKVMTLNTDGSASITLSLAAGTYEFKVYDNSTAMWYGNTGTIEDTAEGWTFTDTGMVNCTLNATGGNYTFRCYTNSEGKFKVDVTK
ncbi:MAG: hypothetical protein Q4B92_08575, partial [Ruminococcus sp.]|nr:hypothetical protein [Ruminococcus sp.]